MPRCGGSAAHPRNDVARVLPDRALPHSLAISDQADAQIGNRVAGAQPQKHLVALAVVRRQAEGDLAAAVAQPGAPILRLGPNAAAPRLFAEQKRSLRSAARARNSRAA